MLSLSDKLKIVNAFEGGKVGNEIQNEFGSLESTFYKIIKSKVSNSPSARRDMVILRGVDFLSFLTLKSSCVFL